MLANTNTWNKFIYTSYKNKLIFLIGNIIMKNTIIIPSYCDEI